MVCEHTAGHMKRTALKPGKPLQRKTQMRKARSKPRPGRVKGKALTQLREECFERDKGCCRECGRAVRYDADPIAEDSYHMAHIKAKRIGGDSLANVRTLCGSCHRSEHAGGKPVPAKGN